MDWSNPDFKRFVELIEKLWPSYKVTPESVRGLWYHSFKNRPVDEIEQSLFAHRSEYPDATRPVWKLIQADLGLRKEGEVNEFMLHIHQIREHGCDNERSSAYPSGRPLTDKSDADVWAHWIRCNSPRYKMAEGIGDEPCVNSVCVASGGCGLTRRHCVGQHWEQAEIQHWVEYLIGKGHKVPDYLTEIGRAQPMPVDRAEGPQTSMFPGKMI